MENGGFGRGVFWGNGRELLFWILLKKMKV